MPDNLIDKITGEKFDEIFYSEYFDLVNKSSRFADCSNNVKNQREASNATAAAFLKLFSKCNDFAHFDIAGTNEFKKFPINPLVLTLYMCTLNIFK